MNPHLHPPPGDTKDCFTKNVNSPKNADGSFLPVRSPKLMADGRFARPSGCQRKGCDWDCKYLAWA